MSLARLLADVRACEVCAADLPCGPRPVVHAHRGARLMIIGQAPGRRVHETGIAWNDPSGDRLRAWLGLDKDVFYGEGVALMPMGFCYPGTGASGDLPPRPECAPLWHRPLLDALPNVELTLLLSRYAHVAYLGSRIEKTVTATVARWREFLPAYLPMPHPSPRNNRWLRKNAWFEAEVVPDLRARVAAMGL